MPVMADLADPSPLWRVPGEGRGKPAAERDSVYFLLKRHGVVAVDAETGGVRWRSTTGELDDARVRAFVPKKLGTRSTARARPPAAGRLVPRGWPRLRPRR